MLSSPSLSISPAFRFGRVPRGHQSIDSRLAPRRNDYDETAAGVGPPKKAVAPDAQSVDDRLPEGHLFRLGDTHLMPGDVLSASWRDDEFI